MARYTRRQFIKQSGAAAIGAAAAAAGVSTLTGFENDAHAAEDKPLDMCIARWKGESTPYDPVENIAQDLTNSAVEALGGMKRFVSKGDVVWVKPNIGWDRTPEQAANTNPEVVAALVAMCLDAGAKTVKVGDYPCNDARRTYKNSGIAEAAADAGAEIVYIDASRFRDMNIGGERLKTTPVYPEIVECDLVISAPVVKHHGSTKVTLAMKNYMGCVGNRRVFHQDLPACIRDITAFMKPRLSVLDAMRILTDHGPTGGDLRDVKRMDTIAAGTDIVALDAFGSVLLGNDPYDIGTVQSGAEAGLGRIDYKALNLKEIALT
jgi:uncharacterized protein (DUF362 family)